MEQPAEALGPEQGEQTEQTEQRDRRLLNPLNRKERDTIDVRRERVVLAAVRLPESRHDPENPFGELGALAQQAGATVVGEMSQMRDKPEPGTHMGKGKLDELAAMCDALDASTIIFDHDLSPRQIGNIEEVTKRKVLDRNELILDIFASRATTREAQVQVELAQLDYTYPRLRAMWTHLERIVGAGGMAGIGTRGPGEQQLEIDRRLVQRRRLALERELAEIHERRKREVRARRSEHFTVGLVGYTNAGKSTLFNTLTAGGAYADDRLFATLMTRTRVWDLGVEGDGGPLGSSDGSPGPSAVGTRVMLSDTVGFVRDLPHDLVASFRSTLEEATHADLLLIVLDVSDRRALQQLETVERTLDDLFGEVEREEAEAGTDWRAPDRLLLLNKADRLASNEELLIWRARRPGAIEVCAMPGPDGMLKHGHEELRRAVLGRVEGEVVEAVFELPMTDARSVHAIESQSRVLERAYEDERVRLRVRVGTRALAKLRLACRSAMVVTAPPVRADRSDGAGPTAPREIATDRVGGV